MAPGTNVGLLEIITAAVTPVVMISASAALILGINQKHQALSDRLRALAAEFRAAETTAERRESIRAQVRLFERRFASAARANLWLYVAVVCFIGMVLVITLAAHTPAWDRVGLGLFVIGIVLMLGAVGLEVLELRLAGRTVELEIGDVLPSGDPGG